MKESRLKGCFCSKEIKGCHSRAFLSGIFRILSSYAKKEKSLCDNDRYVEDPRLQASGMTANWITARAFTLIELLVVVLIIGILAAVAVPQYNKAIEKSQVIGAVSALKSVANAEEVYYLENGEYTTELEKLSVDIPLAPNQINLAEANNEKRVIYGGTKHTQIDWVLKHSTWFIFRPGVYCGALPSDTVGTQICKSMSKDGKKVQEIGCGKLSLSINCEWYKMEIE